MLANCIANDLTRIESKVSVKDCFKESIFQTSSVCVKNDEVSVVSVTDLTLGCPRSNQSDSEKSP